MRRRKAGRRKFGKDKTAALEGLPLYLIILVVITAVAIATILAWLKPWQSTADIQSIQSDVTSLRGAQKNTVIITAFDTKGNKLSGATITLEGGFSIPTQSKSTDSSGTATFADIKPVVPSSFTTGEITFRGEYSGTVPLIKYCKVTVVKVDLDKATIQPSPVSKKTGAQTLVVTVTGTDGKAIEGAGVYLQNYTNLLNIKSSFNSLPTDTTGKATFSIETLKTGQFTVKVMFTGSIPVEKLYTVKIQ
jgi:hypothetical protein